MGHDFRYAARVLGKNPGFTLILFQCPERRVASASSAPE
jgi:hypothetical protein